MPRWSLCPGYGRRYQFWQSPSICAHIFFDYGTAHSFIVAITPGQRSPRIMSAAQSFVKLKLSIQKNFNVKILLFVTGHEDGFLCSYDLSQKVLDEFVRKSIQVVEDKSSVKENRLSWAAGALANYVKSQVNVIEEIPQPSLVNNRRYIDFCGGCLNCFRRSNHSADRLPRALSSNALHIRQYRRGEVHSGNAYAGDFRKWDRNFLWPPHSRTIPKGWHCVKTRRCKRKPQSCRKWLFDFTARGWGGGCDGKHPPWRSNRGVGPCECNPPIDNC